VTALLVLAVLVATGAGTAAAQSPRRPILLSDADWVVRIHETGGFAGLNRSVTLDSEGRVICAGYSSCPMRLSDAWLARIAPLVVGSAQSFRSASRLVPGSDMITTTLVVVVRNDSGLQVESITNWNLSPPDNVENAGEIVSLVRNSLFPD